MTILLVTIGVACSGKTQERWRYKGYTIISPDEVRFEILNFPTSGVHFDPLVENQVWDKVWEDYDAALLDGENIYFDATNLTLERRYRIVGRARRVGGYEVHFIFFKVSLSEIVKRNNQREERRIPDRVLAKQFLQLQLPEPWEYDKLTIIHGY